jgi:hypothetical protein
VLLPGGEEVGDVLLEGRCPTSSTMISPKRQPAQVGARPGAAWVWLRRATQSMAVANITLGRWRQDAPFRAVVRRVSPVPVAEDQDAAVLGRQDPEARARLRLRGADCPRARV